MNPDDHPVTAQESGRSNPTDTAVSSQPHSTPAQAPPPRAISSASSRTRAATPNLVERDHIRSLASGEPSPLSSGLATPTPATTTAAATASTEHPPHQHHHLRSIRPFVHAVMAFEKSRKFSTGTSVHRKRQMSTLVEKEGHFGPALTVCRSFPHRDAVCEAYTGRKELFMPLPSSFHLFFFGDGVLTTLRRNHLYHCREATSFAQDASLSLFNRQPMMFLILFRTFSTWLVIMIVTSADLKLQDPLSGYLGRLLR